MVPARQRAHVSREQVGKVPAMPLVATGQGLPQAPGCGRVAAAGHPGHDASAGALNGQPQPHFALFAGHKGPHLVEFKGLPFPALGLFRPQAGQGRAGGQRFFLSAWPPSCAKRRSRARCCVGSCARRVAVQPVRSAGPAPPPLARSGLGGHTPCSGTWRGPGYYHCAGYVHCRRRRRGVA